MKALIIGFGSIGQRHFKILSKLKNIKKCHIVSKQKIKNIKIFSSLEDVDLNDYAYIIIASKTFLHFEQLKYIERNTENKIILVEKPLFMTNQKLCIKNNKVFVAYNRRFYPIINKIKKIIQKDECYFINIHTGQYLPNWRPSMDYRKTYSAKRDEGGGVLLDLSHEIDYIQFLCGEMNIISAINDKISDLQITSDDFCTVIAKTNKNTIVNFTIDYISKKFIQNIIIHLKNSSIYADLVKMELRIVFKNETFEKYNFDNDRNYSFREMHKDILFNKKSKCCTFKEGQNVLEKIFNIKEINYAS